MQGLCERQQRRLLQETYCDDILYRLNEKQRLKPWLGNVKAKATLEGKKSRDQYCTVRKVRQSCCHSVKRGDKRCHSQESTISVEVSVAGFEKDRTPVKQREVGFSSDFPSVCIAQMTSSRCIWSTAWNQTRIAAELLAQVDGTVCVLIMALIANTFVSEIEIKAA